MLRKLISTAAIAATCLVSIAPGAALAQDYRFAGFDAPRGATASLNLRVPLGRERVAGPANYGLTFGYGREMGTPGADGRIPVRAMSLADLRFAKGDLRHARVAAFDLADMGKTSRDLDRRLGLTGGSGLLVPIIVVGAVGLCVATECYDEIFGGDDDEIDTDD